MHNHVEIEILHKIFPEEMIEFVKEFMIVDPQDKE
jgi:hypothetical protein